MYSPNNDNGYDYGVVPVKNENESEIDYNARVRRFFATSTNPKLKPPQAFHLPKDQKQFEAFMKANPHAQLKLSCGSLGGLQEAMALSKKMGIGNNIQAIQMSCQANELQSVMKTLHSHGMLDKMMHLKVGNKVLSGQALQKEKDNFLTNSAPPEDPNSSAKRRDWAPRPSPWQTKDGLGGR